MTEAKRRRKASASAGKVGSVEVASGKIDKKSSKKMHNLRAGQKMGKIGGMTPVGKIFGVMVTVFYISGISVFNPWTTGRFVRRMLAKPCEGLCDVPEGAADDRCGPVDADRVVFLRIPKTASTTVKSVFESLSSTKNVAVHDIEELEDLTASLPQPGAKPTAQAYHDPDPRVFRKRLQAYYKKATASVVRPTYYAQDRDLFEGHLYHFDWAEDALRMVGPEPKWMGALPVFYRDLYGLDGPTEEDMARVREITFVRRPQDRLASMYYYDRHGARTEWWRKEFVEARGNATLEECLLDPDCVETNELRRWCSVQVELLCGLGKECARPVGKVALEKAKENVRERVLFAGVTERMEESVAFMERLLPTYLEGAGQIEELPRKKETVTSRRETAYSAKAQAVLDDICFLDNEFYQYVNSLLTKRLKECK